MAAKITSAVALLVAASLFLGAHAYHSVSLNYFAPSVRPVFSLRAGQRGRVGPRMVASPKPDLSAWFAPGQKYGPQNPGQPAPTQLPYDNNKLDKNKVEAIKVSGDHLKSPLQQEMADLESIDISDEAVVILKHHGSYQQQNRDLQKSDKKGYADSYQFMLRLKNPCGKVDAKTYQCIDDLSEKYGQKDLRATTRMAFQIHGIRKKDLKTVIASIANAGGSTLGGCGDINRNVMTPPAPVSDPAYQNAFQTANYIAELFKPSSPSFAELWLDGEKAAEVEYWKKDLVQGSTGTNHIPPGTGIITGDELEPLYGRTYLPRKFKVAVTVPGDNSIDAYTHDVCLVVIMDESGKNLKGYNIMVGGGMGRTHNKETTFARTADHLGYIAKEDLTECMKSILAAQRDHGNREIRANARLKYLVHTLGVDNFRKLVESYFGKKIQPWVPLPEWQMVDWLGWHPQGDGKWFLGVNVEQGRIKNEGSFKLKTALRKIVDTYGCDIRLTPHQNIEICGIEEKEKAKIDAILKEHGVKSIQEIDDMTRKGIACPAFPLCGLAQSEAERVMPQYINRINNLMEKMGLPGESFVMRMTGCPNGCARPYMAEMAFVGMGGDSYQIWLGGSPNQDGRTAWRWKDRVKNEDVEGTIEPLLYMWKSQRNGQAERFGDFIHRLGQEAVDKYVESYESGTAFKNVVVEKPPLKKVFGNSFRLLRLFMLFQA
ncbi:sulfite reductase [Guillardia theta CCMP2712]|uniref:assimilatory sulfite reductase (ferredoxin) n=1 Tax=Guillardia theta (strain CCMP2712) TaxID=905079 RepID=L1J1L9_GUITC|nr:sulfite reductase [Guillardia theta CCMP2712]EKX41980.1 sulfite reductase [Guillardia theta CCMP2712]|eukprot:XP_005828960.1 sulfite reductase [Guillardia theta CCMP2712]